MTDFIILGNMEHEHDHSAATHSAGCDACAYVAQVHTHSDEEAVTALSEALAAHNKDEHGEETDSKAIEDAVGAKMQTL